MELYNTFSIIQKLSTGCITTNCSLPFYPSIYLTIHKTRDPRSSPNDPLPAKICQEHLPIIGPRMLNAINESIVSGQVPAVLKQAVINPLLKEEDLDPEILCN